MTVTNYCKYVSDPAPLSQNPTSANFSRNLDSLLPRLLRESVSRYTQPYIMDIDASISTDSPHGASSTRTQLKWTNDMEHTFIATMKAMRGPPSKTVPSGFTKDAYKRVAEIIKDKSSQPELCDPVRMKNKLGALRNDWRTYTNLLNLPWPKLPNGLPTNTDEVLENYYKDQDPNARKFRAAPLRHFDELTELFEPEREGEQRLNSPAVTPSVGTSGSLRQSLPLPLPYSPYQSAASQELINSRFHTPHVNPTSQQSSKRPAESSISNQAKRVLMGESVPPQPPAADTLRAYHGNTSQVSPVAAATSLFKATFSSLPTRQRVAAVKHFADPHVAEIFLHTDDEVREGLVKEWIIAAGIMPATPLRPDASLS